MPFKFDVRFASEMPIQYPIYGVTLRSPDTASSSYFIVRESGNPITSACSHTGVAIALTVFSIQLDRIPVNNRLREVRLEGFVWVNKTDCKAGARSSYLHASRANPDLPKPVNANVRLCIRNKQFIWGFQG